VKRIRPTSARWVGVRVSPSRAGR